MHEGFSKGSHSFGLQDGETGCRKQTLGEFSAGLIIG